MTTKRVDARDALRKLRAPHGGFAMVALDQRESLRRMFPLVDGNEVGDDALRAFKHEATGILSQHASAVLLDRPYGLGDDPRWPLAPHCALIVAADELRQPPDMPVVDTALDPLVTPEYVRRVGASAIKLLVIWRDDGSEARREELVRSFVDVADGAGAPSLVEGIVQPAEGSSWRDRSERHEAILRAAGELASYGGSIYKAEVPGYVPGDMSQVREHAAALTELIDIPWVVLSSGVERDDFADAVRESVLGGASGFLAGRAVWADTVAEPDPGAAMRTRSVGRLENLSRIVEEARA